MTVLVYMFIIHYSWRSFDCFCPLKDPDMTILKNIVCLKEIGLSRWLGTLLWKETLLVISFCSGLRCYHVFLLMICHPHHWPSPSSCLTFVFEPLRLQAVQTSLGFTNVCQASYCTAGKIVYSTAFSTALLLCSYLEKDVYSESLPC